MENYVVNEKRIEGEVKTALFRLRKWLPKPLHGAGVTLTLNDGTEAVGHYVVVESGAVTPCCNPYGRWATSKGFPKTDDGKPLWGGNYPHDNRLRTFVATMGDNYQGDDIDRPVVVSFEGVVMTGHLRTMAGMLAAKRMTDKGYVAWLKDHCQEIGIDSTELAAFPHPRLVVMLRSGEVKEYDCATFQNFKNAEVAFRKIKSSL